MPNNDNNNFENMNNEMSVNNVPPQESVNSPQPIIEIPQTYYEKLAKEQAEEEAAKLAAEPVPQPKTEGGLTSKVIPLILFNALIIFAIFYATVNINVLISAASLGYVVLGSIIFAIKDKKNSEFPVSVIIGGMAAAVVCFVISMLNEYLMDLWTYYTSTCAITGFVGLIIGNIVTKIFTDTKNIKALETLGYLILFAAILGGPYLAYKKWPTEFYQIIFFQQNEVVAETYEEYVLKTLKARYNTEFTCDFTSKENHKTEKNELMTTLQCKHPLIDGDVNIRTIPYNESENQHTIIDDFIDQLYFTEIKTDIENKIKQATAAGLVKVYLYPKEQCIFVGDCADCEDYYKNYSTINDPKNRYEISSSINLSKYLGLSNEDFIKKYINNNEFKVIISLKGTYDKDYTDFNDLSSKALNAVNQTGLKNTYGYEITFYDYESGKYETKVHTAVGNTNDSKEFK